MKKQTKNIYIILSVLFLIILAIYFSSNKSFSVFQFRGSSDGLSSTTVCTRALIEAEMKYDDQMTPCFKYTKELDRCAVYNARKNNYGAGSKLGIYDPNEAIYMRANSINEYIFTNKFEQALYDCYDGKKTLPEMNGQIGSPCVDDTDCVASNTKCNTDINVQTFVEGGVQDVRYYVDVNGNKITADQYWSTASQKYGSSLSAYEQQYKPITVSEYVLPHYKTIPGIMQCGVENPLQPNEQCLNSDMCNQPQVRQKVIPAVTEPVCYFKSTKYPYAVMKCQVVWDCSNVNLARTCEYKYGRNGAKQFWVDEIKTPAQIVNETYKIFNDSIQRVCEYRQCVIPTAPTKVEIVPVERLPVNDEPVSIQPVQDNIINNSVQQQTNNTSDVIIEPVKGTNGRNVVLGVILFMVILSLVIIYYNKKKR